MANRKQHIESIIESVHAIGRKLTTCGLARASARKSARTPITPSQWAVLAVVMKQKNAGVKEIAKTLGITSSAATQLIDGLVNKKYLMREDDASDRRALSLKLSDKSKKHMNDMRARRVERFTGIFKALTDAELAKYAVLNRKIADGVLNKPEQAHD